MLAGMSQGEEEEVKWNAELEVALFHSMHGHKPVGEYVFLLLRKNIFEYIQVNRLRCTLHYFSFGLFSTEIKNRLCYRLLRGQTRCNCQCLDLHSN